VAENVNHLDIALVLDRSGSMQEDTICFGCYERGDSIYPSGDRYPLRWPNNGHLDPWPNGPPPPCDAADPIVSGGNYTLVMEAEFYDNTTHPYGREYTELGDTYWALQRPSESTSDVCDDRTCGSSSLDPSGSDQRGAYMMHMPHGDAGTPYLSVNDDTPRLDYQVALQPGTYYVFVRGQGGAGFIDDPDQGGDTAKTIHWGMDGSYRGRTENFDNLRQGGFNEPVIDSDSWRWTRLSGNVNLTGAATRTLNIWAGGLGFRLDKIILTTDYYYNPSGVGPGETHGRDEDGLACNPCNPGYGLDLSEPYNCDNRRDDLYDDDQPLRFLMEAAKDFIARLDPRVDQVGLVTYSNRATIDQYLQCLVQDGDDCTDFDAIVDAIDAMVADGGTNIPDGIRQGMEVFAHENSRGAAAHMIILMTDGQTNQTDGLPSACWAEDLWPNQSGETTAQRRSRDCVVYYANQAKETGYVIYAISLGQQADLELLDYIAEETGGQHYNTPHAEDLSEIFNSIADHIFLRLIE